MTTARSKGGAKANQDHHRARAYASQQAGGRLRRHQSDEPTEYDIEEPGNSARQVSGLRASTPSPQPENSAVSPTANRLRPRDDDDIRAFRRPPLAGTR